MVARKTIMIVKFTDCNFQINLGRYQGTETYKVGKCLLVVSWGRLQHYIKTKRVVSGSEKP